ncbi:MAG: hypothetical protein FJZ98_01420 [Chloroflexi bacterium]|nr:hypothetical protein [Chloroflexota bacterium]
MLTSIPKKFTLWTGWILFFFGIIYMFLLAVMFLFSDFPPVEPFLTSFNSLILLSAILVLVFWASIYSSIPKEKNFFSLLSVLFMVVFTTLTSINRFVALTVVRQSTKNVISEILSLFLPYS